MPTLNTSETHSLRCVLLMGGHAGGKSTLFRWGRDRINGTPGYTWHSEGGNGGRPSVSTLPVKEALALASKEWTDLNVHTMVVEGTRVYGPVFQVARDCYDVGRELWILQLLQTPDVGRAHMRARLAAKGKEYNAAYWDRWEAEYQFAQRYTAAYRKFMWSQGGMASPSLGEQLALWVERGHGNLGPARTWFANALRVPIVPRTPVRLEQQEHGPVRTPIHWEPPAA
jgi:hypothetical protein